MLSLSRPSRAAPAVCVDDSISVLVGPNNQKLTLIGTAHISEESVAQVRRIIRAQAPDTVMVELDPKRIGKLKTGEKFEDYGFVLPVSSSSSSSSSSASSSAAPGRSLVPAPPQPPAVVKAVQGSTNFFQTAANSLAAAALGKALSGFYGNVEKIGFTAGGEFKAAGEEARKIDARVLLGDRDVEVTLSHLASALGQTTPEQFTALADALDRLEGESGLFLGGDGGGKGASGSLALPAAPGSLDGLSREEISSFMERLKTRSSITQLTSLMAQNVPALYNALIAERDAFMADAIADRMTVEGSRSLVAVCGFAHVPGMEKALTERRRFVLQRRNC